MVVDRPENLLPFADVAGDGFINEDDAVALINTITGRNPAKTLPLASIRETSPFAGESTVALTREIIVRSGIIRSPEKVAREAALRLIGRFASNIQRRRDCLSGYLRFAGYFALRAIPLLITPRFPTTKSPGLQKQDIAPTRRHDC